MKIIDEIYFNEVRKAKEKLGDAVFPILTSDLIKKFSMNLLIEHEKQTKELPRNVIAWLGQHRDKLPIEAIHSLQDICNI